MVIDNKLITAHAGNILFLCLIEILLFCISIIFFRSFNHILGDSRAVLCRDKKAIRLTEDHKPERADELARVEELGLKETEERQRKKEF